MKENGKFEEVIDNRKRNVKPIIHYWKSGKLKEALYTMNQYEDKIDVVLDCVNTIVNTPQFKSR